MVQLFLYLHRKRIFDSFWKLERVWPTLLDAGSESVHMQAWKAGLSCGDHHVIVALSIRLHGDFNSLRSDDLVVITKQNLPYVTMKLAPTKGDPLAKARPSPVFMTGSFQEHTPAHSS